MGSTAEAEPRENGLTILRLLQPGEQLKFTPDRSEFLTPEFVISGNISVALQGVKIDARHRYSPAIKVTGTEVAAGLVDNFRDDELYDCNLRITGSSEDRKCSIQILKAKMLLVAKAHVDPNTRAEGSTLVTTNGWKAIGFRTDTERRLLLPADESVIISRLRVHVET